VTLEQLWAGWRAGYVASVTAGEGARDDEGLSRCVFCRIIGSDEPDSTRHVVCERADALALLNAYPYASGHLLVMPRRHVSDLAGLGEGEASALWALVRDALEALEKAYHPDGYNIGANLGRAAGAGIPEHLHFHVVPRWLGDTNFMTTVASVRVMPEALSESWSKLRAAWPS
jgi:ATP adenylyltransferase